jgi:branched-chain amino acid transport system permease protein
MTYIVIALGLNLLNGQAGQFSIGHAAFAAIGAYTAGAITTMVGPRYFPWEGAMPPELSGIGMVCFFAGAVLAGGLLAAISGFLVGMPALRLRGDYLAIATLGFGEIVRVLITNAEPLGGALGMHGIPKWSTLPVLGFACVATVALCRNIATSVPGRCLVALREDEIAAESLGISTTRAKVAAMTLSAGIAGVGGALLAHRQGSYLTPDIGWMKSVEFVLMVVLGGSGSISGTVVAALFLGMLPGEMLRLGEYPIVLKLTGNKMVIYSLLLIVAMLLSRQARGRDQRISLGFLFGGIGAAIGVGMATRFGEYALSESLLRAGAYTALWGAAGVAIALFLTWAAGRRHGRDERWEVSAEWLLGVGRGMRSLVARFGRSPGAGTGGGAVRDG